MTKWKMYTTTMAWYISFGKSKFWWWYITCSIYLVRGFCLMTRYQKAQSFNNCISDPSFSAWAKKCLDSWVSWSSSLTVTRVADIVRTATVNLSRSQDLQRQVVQPISTCTGQMISRKNSWNSQCQSLQVTGIHILLVQPITMTAGHKTSKDSW